jgi:hypothetical protein
MKFSPTLLFWLQFTATVGAGVTGGAVHLTGWVPMEEIPRITGAISFGTFVIMTFLTLATGAVGVGAGPLARPPTIAEAREVMAEAAANQTKPKGN